MYLVLIQAYALYHHRFPLYREQLIQLTKVDAGALSVLAKIRQVLDYNREVGKNKEDAGSHEMVVLKRNELIGVGGRNLPPSTRNNLMSTLLRFVEANSKVGVFYFVLVSSMFNCVV